MDSFELERTIKKYLWKDRQSSFGLTLSIFLFAFLIGWCIGTGFTSLALQWETGYQWIAGIASGLVIVALFLMFIIGLIILLIFAGVILYLSGYIPSGAVLYSDKSELSLYIWLILLIAILIIYAVQVIKRLVNYDPEIPFWLELKALFPGWIVFLLFLFGFILAPAYAINGYYGAFPKNIDKELYADYYQTLEGNPGELLWFVLPIGLTCMYIFLWVYERKYLDQRAKEYHKAL